MAAHRANPTCNACHGVMDPLGFALENFDAIGDWRDVDALRRRRSTRRRQLPDGTQLNGPATCATRCSRSPDQFAQTLTEKLMTYALGRGARVLRHAGRAADRARRRQGRLQVPRIVWASSRARRSR